MSNFDFSKAIKALHSDDVICYPTEGVWGLGCHPRSLQGFQKLLQLKQRPAEKGVIVLAGNISQLRDYVAFNSAIEQVFDQYKHDFITLIVPQSKTCPQYLSGQFDEIAVRVTNYPPLKELCLQAQTALVSTSANLSGKLPVADIQHARYVFGNNIHYVDMPLGGQTRPSKIVKWHNGEIMTIRE